MKHRTNCPLTRPPRSQAEPPPPPRVKTGGRTNTRATTPTAPCPQQPEVEGTECPSADDKTNTTRPIRAAGCYLATAVGGNAGPRCDLDGPGHVLPSEDSQTGDRTARSSVSIERPEQAGAQRRKAEQRVAAAGGEGEVRVRGFRPSGATARPGPGRGDGCALRRRLRTSEQQVRGMRGPSFLKNPQERRPS